ncbi:MAG: site-specific integrase, partial [Methanothrix sp.]
MTESSSHAVSSPSNAPVDLPTELISRYREDCAMRGMSPESLRRYISSLKIYARYLQERDLDILNVDRNVLRSFLEYLRNDRNVGLKTIGNYFTSMAMFYEFLEFEEYVDKNPVHSVRKRYIRRYKDNDDGQMRKLISVEEMARLINSTLDVRDKAIITLLAKTGIRRKELITLDVDDLDWVDQSIRLK